MFGAETELIRREGRCRYLAWASSSAGRSGGSHPNLPNRGPTQTCSILQQQNDCEDFSDSEAQNRLRVPPAGALCSLTPPSVYEP